MRTLVLLAVFAISTIPAMAQSGASGMQYYVGTWSCTGGTIGQPAAKATLTYTMDSGILHQTVAVPKQGKMPKAYYSSSSTTYDSKGSRYISGGVSNDPASFSSTWTLSGNVETDRDTWVSSGKPGHGQTIRTSNSMFTYTGYPTLTAAKPNFKAVCRRNS